MSKRNWNPLLALGFQHPALWTAGITERFTLAPERHPSAPSPHEYCVIGHIQPDGFTFRVGVTTVVDAGSSGWRNFPDFKDQVIDRSKTRVLALLNIVGNGMRGERSSRTSKTWKPSHRGMA